MFCQRTRIKICAFARWQDRHARVTLSVAASDRAEVEREGSTPEQSSHMAGLGVGPKGKQPILPRLHQRDHVHAPAEVDSGPTMETTGNRLSA